MKLADYLSETETSRADFAASIGVSEVTVTRYVNGDRRPHADQMRRIIEATQGRVRPDDFFDLAAPSPAPAAKAVA